MARSISIKPSRLAPPPSRKDGLARNKAVKLLRADRQMPPDVDLDPIEFAKAFATFSSDMDLLSVEEQGRFQATLRGYLAGHVDHDEWRQVVAALSALRRAATPAEPAGYWSRTVVAPSAQDDGW